MNRRSILKQIGAVSTGLTMTGAVQAQQIEDALSNRSVNELSEWSWTRASVLREAYTDPEFGNVINHLRREYGRVTEEKVFSIETEDDIHYNSVVLEFDGPADEDVVATWHNYPKEDGQSLIGGYVINSSESITTQSSEISKVHGSRITSEKGKISTEEVDSEFIVSTTEGVSAQNHESGEDGCGRGCYVEYYTCDSVDWSCVLGIPAALVGLGASYGSCLACGPQSLGLACGVCISAITSGGLAGFDCIAADNIPFSDECTKHESFIEKSRFDEEDWLDPEEECIDWDGSWDYRSCS